MAAQLTFTSVRFIHRRASASTRSQIHRGSRDEFPSSRRYLDTRIIRSRFLSDIANPASHSSRYATMFPLIFARHASRISRIREGIMAVSSTHSRVFNGLGVVCALLYDRMWFQNNRAAKQIKTRGEEDDNV